MMPFVRNLVKSKSYTALKNDGVALAVLLKNMKDFAKLVENYMDLKFASAQLTHVINKTIEQPKSCQHLYFY